MLIPSGVFAKYDSVATDMILELGENCTIIYPDTIVTTSRTVSPIRQQKTMFINPAGPEFSRGDEEFATVQNVEDVKMRVYWDQKSYKKLSDLAIPQGGVMCIGKLVVLPKIRKATSLIIHKVADGSHEEYKFDKFAEPQLHGLNNNFVISFWARS